MTKNDRILQSASGDQIPSSKSRNEGWGGGNTKQQKEACMAENMAENIKIYIIRELYKRGNKGSSNKINNITFVITVYF